MHYIVLILALGSAAAITECPEGSQFSSGECVPCKPGYYSFTRKRNLTRICLPCPVGTSQPAFGAVAVDVCRPCWPGTFASEEASTACKPCPIGTWSFFGAHKCDTCPPGTTILADGAGCKACPIGWYSTTTNSVRCTQCPFLTTTSGEGATSPASCKPCSGGRSCRKCWTNSYFDDYKPYRIPGEDPTSTLMCRQCPSGTDNRRSRAISSASQCQPCPKGWYSDSLRGPSVCQPCKNGRSTAAPGGMYCRKDGQACPADTYETSKGDCRFCDRGYRFVPKKQICEKCAIDELSKGGLSTECYKCPNNLVPDLIYPRCVCEMGHEQRGNRCVPCARGYFNDSPYGLVPCKECYNGIAPREGTARCQPCPLGLVPNAERTMCIECPPGLMPNILREFERGKDNGHSYCVLPQTRCAMTEQRFVAYDNSFTFCGIQYCSRNSEQSDVGVNCKACDKGNRLHRTDSRCIPCPKESISDGGLVKRCTPCRNGNASVGDGDECGCYGSHRINYGMQDGVCKKCPEGQFSNIIEDVCKPCGTAQIITRTRCRFCPPYRVPSEDQTKCVACPTGTIPNRAYHADKCLWCVGMVSFWQYFYLGCCTIQSLYCKRMSTQAYTVNMNTCTRSYLLIWATYLTRILDSSVCLHDLNRCIYQYYRTRKIHPVKVP